MNASIPCAVGIYCPCDGNMNQKKCDAGSKEFYDSTVAMLATSSSAEIPCNAGFSN
jgi:hypothetical protein